ncbi:alpha/beta fold hydrolase [Bizionia sp. KMM 8389]
MILDYNGSSVFYTDQGQGTPIVLLHGFLENSNMWKNITPLLSETHRVISIDLLGHGNSECLGYIHNMELMANVVHKVLHTLQISKSIFIGHSMGGYVALAFAEKYPSQVLKLCLANSTSKADSPERKQNRDRAIQAVKKNHEIFVRLAVTNLFTIKNQAVLKDEILQVRKEALKTPLQGIIATLEGMKVRPDRTLVLKNASFPKLFLIGQKDAVMPYKKLVSEAEETHSEFSLLPDGHMSHIENEAIFLQEIMHFIE